MAISHSIVDRKHVDDSDSEFILEIFRNPLDPPKETLLFVGFGGTLGARASELKAFMQNRSVRISQTTRLVAGCLNFACLVMIFGIAIVNILRDFKTVATENQALIARSLAEQQRLEECERQELKRAKQERDRAEAAVRLRREREMAAEQLRREQEMAAEQLRREREMIFTERWTRITEIFISHQVALRGSDITLDVINSGFRSCENDFQDKWSCFENIYVHLKEWIQAGFAKHRTKSFYELAKPVFANELPWDVVSNLLERIEANRTKKLFTVGKAIEEFDRIYEMIRVLYEREYPQWKESAEKRHFDELDGMLDELSAEDDLEADDPEIFNIDSQHRKSRT